MIRTVGVAALFAAALLAGCATGYGPKGMTGGYEDKQIDESTYRVAFYGNGKTDKDTVWNYWIYRCAELTKEKGFELFSLIPEKKGSAIPGSDGFRTADLRSGDEGEAIKTAGGYSPPRYYYTPGSSYTITTYSSSALVKMYREPLPQGVAFAMRAQTVLDALKPFVESGGSAPAPKREELIEKAVVKNKV